MVGRSVRRIRTNPPVRSQNESNTICFYTILPLILITILVTYFTNTFTPLRELLFPTYSNLTSLSEIPIPLIPLPTIYFPVANLMQNASLLHIYSTNSLFTYQKFTQLSPGIRDLANNETRAKCATYGQSIYQLENELTIFLKKLDHCLDFFVIRDENVRKNLRWDGTLGRDDEYNFFIDIRTTCDYMQPEALSKYLSTVISYRSSCNQRIKNDIYELVIQPLEHRLVRGARSGFFRFLNRKQRFHDSEVALHGLAQVLEETFFDSDSFAQQIVDDMAYSLGALKAMHMSARLKWETGYYADNLTDSVEILKTLAWNYGLSGRKYRHG